jgi:hypothetical protein
MLLRSPLRQEVQARIILPLIAAVLSSGHPARAAEEPPPRPPRELVIEEFSNMGVLRHHIPLPNDPAAGEPVEVKGIACRAMLPEEGYLVAQVIEAGRTPRFSRHRSTEMLTLTVRYRLSKESAGLKILVSQTRSAFHQYLAKYNQDRARDGGRNTSFENYTRNEHGGDRTLLLPTLPSTKWKRGTRSGASRLHYQSQIAYRIETSSPSSEVRRVGLTVGIRPSVLDSRIRLNVLSAPTNPRSAVLGFWGVGPLKIAAQAKKVALLSVKPASNDWGDVMWAFRCARTEIEMALGSKVPVFASGFSAGGIAAVMSAAWFPGEIQGILCDGQSDMKEMEFGDPEGKATTFRSRGDTPTVYIIGKRDGVYTSARSAYQGAKFRGRRVLWAEHSGGHTPGVSSQYGQALTWLLDQVDSSRMRPIDISLAEWELSPEEKFARWAPGWKVVACGKDMDPGFHTPEGKPAFLALHPVSRTEPAVLEANLRIPEGKPCLILPVSSYLEMPQSDWVLRVTVNGEQVVEKVIHSPGKWQEVRLDLSRSAGKTVTVRIENAAGGANDWAWEAGYFLQPRLVATDMPTP